ncbi:MAG: cytochrome b5 domain-containing protein [Candidatus Bathyarchaeota archaeon]
MPKYGKPIWQYVFEAAKEINGTFTSVDIINKVKQINSKIPDVTIRSNVIAMAPNHPFSFHWPSTRKLHGFFNYLGEGRFTLLEKDNKDIIQVKDVKLEISEQDIKVTNLVELKKFKVKELEDYNGKDGKPAYVAYNKEVFDLSQSNLWSNGNHMGSHEAGKDITEELKLAPHGKEVFEREKVKHVGKLV